METKFIPDDHWKSEIARFFKGELTFSEEQMMHQWVNENAEHALYFEEMRNTWLSSVSINTESDQIGADWEKMNSQFDNFDQKSLPKITPAPFWTLRRIAAIAAMFIVAMAIGAFISRAVSPVGLLNNDEICEVITPLGAQSQVILPDGTQVWLNAGSRLTYKKSFNSKDRLVTLQGEAFFQVTTNKKKPFIVQTSKLRVKALGTSFNVKAYPEDKSVTATLVEGIIQVEGKGTNAKPFNVTLKPKETITFKEKTPETANPVADVNPGISMERIPEKITQIEPGVLINRNVKTEKFTSWKDVHWQVEAENLDNLSVLLGRRFNVVIHQQSLNLKDYRFTGTIQNETLEQVLEILKLTTPLKCRIGKGEVWWDIDSTLQKQYTKILVEKNIRR